MNRKAVAATLRIIENAPEALVEMQHFSSYTPCGTAHCIAGWAIEAHPEEAPPLSENSYPAHPAELAARILGLDEALAEDLFYIKDKHLLMSKQSKQDVVNTLRHLLATGEVKWTKASRSLPSSLTDLLEEVQEQTERVAA